MSKTKSKSEIISDFLKLVSECKQNATVAFEEIGKQDKITVDLLHEMEFESYKDRQKNSDRTCALQAGAKIL